MRALVACLMVAMIGAACDDSVAGGGVVPLPDRDAMPAPPPRGGELINGRTPSFRNEYEVLHQRLHKYDINSNFHGTPC